MLHFIKQTSVNQQLYLELLACHQDSRNEQLETGVGICGPASETQRAAVTTVTKGREYRAPLIKRKHHRHHGMLAAAMT
jgi:hypothetical protein